LALTLEKEQKKEEKEEEDHKSDMPFE